MGTLKEDIRAQATWIVRAFKADKFKLDYTLNSFKEIDRFFDQHSKNGEAVPNGRLSVNLGPIIFSIGSYVGETLIRLAPGTEWETDDSDPEGEVKVTIKFPGGGICWPMQKAMKRFMNGEEDSIYHYGVVLLKEMTNIDPANLAAQEESAKKPWWKFW